MRRKMDYIRGIPKNCFSSHFKALPLKERVMALRHSLKESERLEHDTVWAGIELDRIVNRLSEANLKQKTIDVESEERKLLEIERRNNALFREWQTFVSKSVHFFNNFNPRVGYLKLEGLNPVEVNAHKAWRDIDSTFDFLKQAKKEIALAKARQQKPV